MLQNIFSLLQRHQKIVAWTVSTQSSEAVHFQSSANVVKSCFQTRLYDTRRSSYATRTIFSDESYSSSINCIFTKVAAEGHQTGFLRHFGALLINNIRWLLFRRFKIKAKFSVLYDSWSEHKRKTCSTISKIYV